MGLDKPGKPVQRVDFIKGKCQGKRVLHLGCTNWPYTADSISNEMLLHLELQKVATELYGLDFDQQGIDVLTRHGCKNIFHADLEKLGEVGLEAKFDVIIAGEIIEHLNNPGLFLDGIKRFMHPETALVLTTINAYCGMRFFIYALRGMGGANEPVHPDHVAYYSYSTLRLLMERFKFNVDEIRFYDVGREHRQFNRWLFNLVNDACVWFSPQLSDGIIAVCSHSETQ